MPRVLLASSLLACAACVGGNADSPVAILENQFVVDTCAVTGSPGSFNSSGIVDLANPDREVGYVFTPVVQNFATSSTTDEQLRIAFVRGARVDIRFYDDALDSALYPMDGLTRFEVPLAASIEPGGTIGLLFEIIPAALLDQLSDGDLLEVHVKIFGEIGGSEFESADFPYPVQACNGCTVQNLGACSGVASDYVAQGQPHGCNPYQDFQVECCTSASGLLVCPAEGTAETP